MSRHMRRLERRIKELEAQLSPTPEPPKGAGIRPISPTGERVDFSNSRRMDRRTTDAWALYLFELVKDRSADVRAGLLDRVVKEAERRGLAPAASRRRRGRKQPFDPSARNLRALGPKFERDELLSMLRAAAEWAETSYLSWSRFAVWAKQEAERQESPFARLPREVCAFRRVFGSWSRACREAGVECGQPVLDVTEEQLLSALRATAESVGREIVRFEDYLGFIEGEAGDPKSRFGALPRSRQAFIGRFGSFAAACVAAGLKNGRVIDGEVRKSRVTVGLNDYDDEDLLAALRQATASRGGKPPTEAFFYRWLRQADTQARTDGRLLALLSPASYRTRFGSWPDALHRAGLISETQRRRLLQRRPITDEAIWDTVTSALREFGPGISRAQYQGFAHRLIEESDDPEVRVPSFEVVARRLGDGNFKAAIKRVWDAGARELERKEATGSEAKPARELEPEVGVELKPKPTGELEMKGCECEAQATGGLDLKALAGEGGLQVAGQLGPNEAKAVEA